MKTQQEKTIINFLNYLKEKKTSLSDQIFPSYLSDGLQPNRKKVEKIIFKSACPGHTITSSNKNRFMEDQTFVKGGGFDLES